ncbi:hypothetical protein NW761_008572 [Fusarium oxysporum]|nr:hypothetical protein NW761_008572 [Fusarium oxysporum]
MALQDSQQEGSTPPPEPVIQIQDAIAAGDDDDADSSIGEVCFDDSLLLWVAFTL